ncbi:MAG: hypothetical protein B7Z62_02715 [Deltaproteobacteria bacterium 37-65-8]|nr:DUF1844 domain-containing protein [Deltaproteobacteria bacterium]OYV98865.1 MAG: hypothetical protein B7Z62_02715 [Deltaproteobacteria bacterium 37-65-8]HQT97392.1 DUF1844 domain-containing protein [Thermodesulfobacteriota bacterium]
MPEEKEDKGFKVIDRRGQEPPSPPSPEKTSSGATAGQGPPLPGEVPPTDGNQPPPPGVKEGKGREEARSSALGGPRFLDLVQSLQVGAMAGLGMLQGPDGKRPPADLPAAKDAIDLLGILQEKTKGNLTKEEEEVLREGLYHLRMGYMAMINAPPAGRKKEGDPR